MKKNNRYVFGAALAGMALSGVHGMMHGAQGAVLSTVADFTFDSNLVDGTLPASGTLSSSSASYLADVGTGTAYGYHAATGSEFYQTTGDGTQYALLGYDWTVGDYWKFAVPTTNIQNILLNFDEVSSSTGPTQFELAYSTDGTNFSSYSSYTVDGANSLSTFVFTYDGTNTASAGATKTGSGWSSSYTATSFHYSFDISDPNLTNDPNAAFELIAQTLSFSGSTDRIDNFVVSGTVVPEPATLSLLSVASAALLMRRRKP